MVPDCELDHRLFPALVTWSRTASRPNQKQEQGAERAGVLVLVDRKCRHPLRSCRPCPVPRFVSPAREAEEDNNRWIPGTREPAHCPQTGALAVPLGALEASVLSPSPHSGSVLPSSLRASSLIFRIPGGAAARSPGSIICPTPILSSPSRRCGWVSLTSRSTGPDRPDLH